MRDMIALSMWSLTSVSFEKAVEIAFKLGFESVELWLDTPHINVRVYDSVIKARNILEQYGFKHILAHAPCKNVNIVSSDMYVYEESRKLYLKALEACMKLNVEILTVHPGRVEDGKYSSRLRESIELIRELAFKSGDIILAVENMCGIVGRDLGIEPSEIMNYVREGFDKVKITFDIGHAHIMNMVEEYLKPNIVKHIVNVHVHNNNGIVDQHNPVNRGSCQVREVLNSILFMNRRTILTLEINPSFGVNGIRDSLNALRVWGIG